MESNEAISTLEAMGFERAQIDLAVKSTGSTNIEVLITFLEQLQNGSENIPQQSGGQAVGGQPQEQQGSSISGLVNQEHVAILMSLGHSKIVSEKSLLMTENKGTEAAIAWIEAHKTDADFEEELLLVQNEKKMSPQEAAEAAKELGRRLREKRRLQEEQDALERERNRIKSGKQMNDVRRDLEEQKKRLDAELAKKQRMQDQKDKEAMLAQLQRDREERFGKKASSGAQTQQQIVQQKTYTPFELFNTGIKQVKIASPPDLLPEKAKNSLSLIQKILENIIKNPQEPKFRKISLTSQVFQTKIEDTFGARQALDGLGFVEQEGFYQYNGSDIQLLQQALGVVATELMGL